MLTKQSDRLCLANGWGWGRLLLGCCCLSVVALVGCLPQELIQKSKDNRPDDPLAEAPADVRPIRVREKSNSAQVERLDAPPPDAGAAVVRGVPKGKEPEEPMVAGSDPAGVSMSVGRNNEARGPVGTGAHAEIQRSQPKSSAPSSSTPPNASGSGSVAGASGAGTKNNDPNAAKIEVFLQGWLSAEHQEDLESCLVRGREPTTFEADRYYVIITTTGDHSYNVTVDVYHSGKIRVFKSQKLY
ncbi:MAG: hypothetical protein JNL67_20205 [Planctomycetaceae bacterium]|nr:hypothetical protein [Planctomycetaceae bacterium]